MAVTADRVVVELEARLDRYDRRIAGARQRFDRSMGQIRGAAGATEARTERAFANIGRAANAMIATVIGALGVREITRYADAWTEAGNKIAAATQISGIQGATLSDLADAAIEARTAFEPYVDLFARIQRAGANLNITQREVAAATEIVSKAFVAGGASAQEQASGILQLGQALASGELLGEELRAIRENAPLVAQAIAEEFDTTIGGLKKLGEQGELTAERVLAGILNAQGKIEAAFATTNASIGDSFQNLRTALIRFVGDTDDAVGASEKLAEALNALAENLDIVASAAALLAARGLAPLVAALGTRLAIAARAGAAAIASLGTAATASATAIGILRGALALLGGPVGAVLIGLTGAGIALSRIDTGARSAEDGINRFRDAIAKAESSLSDLQSVEQALERDTEALKEANERLNDAVASGGDVAEATAQADVAAINRRIAANEELRDAIIETLKAQQQSLQAQANIARRSLLSEVAGDVPTSERTIRRETTPGGAVFQFRTRRRLAEDEIAARQEAELERRLAEARAANAAGDISKTQAALLDLNKDFLVADTSAKELLGTIDAILSGGSAGAGDGAGGGGGSGGGGGGAGGSDAQKLNDFEQAVARLREQNLAAGAEITALNQLSPVLDDYAIGLSAAAIEQDLLTKAKEAGIEADRQQIRNLAEGTAALEEQRRAAADFGSAVDGIKAETTAIERETEALAGINPAIEDYGFAVERALAEQELWNLALEAGLAPTDELREAIEGLAEGYGIAAAAAREQAEAQEDFKRGVDDFKQTSRDVFGNFIQGALDGKKATDILADALDDIAAKLFDLSLNAIFDTGGGSAQLAGFLGALGGIFGGSFDAGGPTGGRKGRPAGIVHGEEFVVKAGPAQKFRPILEAINDDRKLPGFQEGGFVERPPARPIDLDLPDLPTRTIERSAAGDTVIQLGGLHVNGVRDVDDFRRSEPQLMADLQRKLSNVARRGTA